MFNIMHVAVLGHANAGKTALLRTLTRTHSFGKVSDLPDTTQKPERVSVTLGGTERLRFIDTPGFGDPVGLSGYLLALDGPSSMSARIATFLRGPEAKHTFYPEAQAMTAAASADVVLYVVDTREAPLPKFQYELDMLLALGKPVLPVRNFTSHPRSRAAEWDAVFVGNNLFNAVTFDAVAPDPDSEADLYGALAKSAAEWRSYLDDFVKALAAEAEQKRVAAGKRIAELLVQAAAARDTISKDDFADPDKRDTFTRTFKRKIIGMERDCVDDLLAVYRFRDEDADLDMLAVSDRWEADLFNPETLRQAGMHLTGGAAIGAGVGVAVDLAFAGLTLGAGAAIGAAIGGAASQGMTQFGRKVYHKVRGIQEISASNDVLAVMASHMVELVRILEHRPHAASGKIKLSVVPSEAGTAAYQAVLEAAQPARNYPDWSTHAAQGADADTRRNRTITAVADALATLFHSVWHQSLHSVTTRNDKKT